MPNKTLGLIAGNGKFPLMFAREARRQGYTVIAAGVKGDTSLLLRFVTSQCRMFYVGDLQKLFDYFRSHNIKQVLMAGQVNQKNLFDPRVKLDSRFQKLFNALQDHKADTIFAAVADLLASEGMELVDSTLLLKNYLAPAGCLTRRAPTPAELEDITFGREIAKAMGGLDVGQTVVIKDKAIVAIEAMEGTDKTIFRGGRIAQQGAVVVKMSKPNQDFRFDVPVIGPRTIQTMIKCSAKCLAIEAGKTLIVDREKTVAAADRAGISIYSV